MGEGSAPLLEKEAELVPSRPAELIPPLGELEVGMTPRYFFHTPQPFRSFLLCRLDAPPGFLLSEFGGQVRAEVFGLKPPANFHFVSLSERGALQPLDRLFHRADLPQPEAGDQLLRLGKRPLDHRALSFCKLDALAFRTGLKPFARQHDARLHQILLELTH